MKRKRQNKTAIKHLLKSTNLKKKAGGAEKMVGWIAVVDKLMGNAI